MGVAGCYPEGALKEDPVKVVGDITNYSYVTYSLYLYFFYFYYLINFNLFDNRNPFLRRFR